MFLRKQPTLLEYLGYVFNFSSVFCGPPMEYQDYMDFIEGKQFDEYKVTFLSQYFYCTYSREKCE